MGVREDRHVEEDLRAPYYSLEQNRMDTGIMPSQNTPGTTGLSTYVKDAKGVVTDDPGVGDEATSVTFTLPDDGGIDTALLLLPYDTDNTRLYKPSECVPQYLKDDEIHVFKTEDGTWYAPGPFIPKEVIKAIFECP